MEASDHQGAAEPKAWGKLGFPRHWTPVGQGQPGRTEAGQCGTHFCQTLYTPSHLSELASAAPYYRMSLRVGQETPVPVLSLWCLGAGHASPGLLELSLPICTERWWTDEFLNGASLSGCQGKSRLPPLLGPAPASLCYYMGFYNPELLHKLPQTPSGPAPAALNPFPASQARKPRLPPMQDRGPGFKQRRLLSLLRFAQKTQTVSALQRPQTTGVNWGQSQCHNLVGLCQLWGSPSSTPRCHPQSDQLATELPTATAIFPSSPRMACGQPR